MKQIATVTRSRTIVYCIFCVSLIWVLAACVAPSGGTTTGANVETTDASSASESVSVTFWNGFTGTDRPILEGLVNRFNESQDEVQIDMEIMDWNLLYQKLATSAASDEGPDFIVFGPENIATYADMGAIVPVDDFYETERIDESLFPAVFDQLTEYDGHKIGIPMNVFAFALYYNKDLVTAAGLDPETPPTNWDELSVWAEALTDQANGQYGLYIGNGIYLVQDIWANGGDILDYATKTSTLNAPEAVEAVQYFADLYHKGVSPAPNTDGGQLFAAGKLGMLIDGPWRWTQANDAGVNFGMALVPAGPKDQVTFGAGLSWHLTGKGAADPAVREAFYKFVTWWFDKEQQREWAIKSGFAPVRTDMLDDADLLEANPDLATFMGANEMAQPWLLGIVNSQRIQTEITGRYFDEILINNADVQTTLDQASAALDEILATER